MSAHRHLFIWAIASLLLTACGGGGGGPANLLGLGTDCETQAQCKSGRCDTTVAERIPEHVGLCCGGEHCCLTPADCPDSYRSPSQCQASGCQGTRVEATCLGFSCGKQTVDDDRGCAGKAQDCTPYAPIACTGSADQQPPVCGTSCTRKSDCADGYACDGTQCVAMRKSGDTCTPVAGTTQGTCDAGYKCDHGFCCDATSAESCCGQTSDDCPASYRSASACSVTDDSTSQMCQGTEVVATCSDRHVCGKAAVENDSGCAGRTHTCGGYKSIACTGATVQTSPVCVTSCNSTSDCSSGHVCNTLTHECVPEVAAGSSCTTLPGTTQGTCASGLKCAGGYCCNASADGTCCPTGSTCAGGLACSSNACVTACTVNTSIGCAVSGTYCTDGAHCTAKKTTGTACTAGGQCSTNTCYQSACCSPKHTCGSRACGTFSDGCGGSYECDNCDSDPDPPCNPICP